ncbi:hypothetical protein CRX51_17390 [Pluralibacter gergoviae]|nr:hypothetical protein CRX51_17390 [Pluralibacter gergoviae]
MQQGGQHLKAGIGQGIHGHGVPGPQHSHHRHAEPVLGAADDEHVIRADIQPAAASATGDLLMLAAVAVCGLGYAEGARLSRKLGGWQVICWALVVALPVMAAGAVYSFPSSAAAIHPTAWAALGYVSLFSMLIGFIFWYRGLAIGGIAAVGQLQLLQPLLGLMLSALLLHESIGTAMLATTAGVILCVAGAKRFA